MNITLKEIRQEDRREFEKLVKLYESAFPKRERRDSETLREMIGRSDMKFFAIHKEDEQAGFIIAWKLEGFTFLEHFAIFDNMRGGGIGETVMTRIKERFPGCIILEVEPEEDEITKRRIGFYRRSGFEIITKEYIQPPYRKEDHPAQLWLMSNTFNLTTSQIEQFIKTIYNLIYSKP